MASEDGWEPARLAPGDPLLVWKTVPGTTVSLQVMRGLPEVFLIALAADFNAYVEPLRDPDSASYTPTNKVDTSNHLNGTACDLNWDSHEFEERGTFNAAQMVVIRQLVDFYEGWIYWAGDWTSPVDEMHWQMGYNTWNRNTAALDFMARKIRSDGFSTFRRGALSPSDPPNAGATPTTPPPADSDSDDSPVLVLYDAVPVIDQDRADYLTPLIMAGLALAGCTTVKAIAMWLAQMGHESGGFVYTEEIAKNGRYAPYIGRTWIQITWETNYRSFGVWCVDEGLLDDSEYFIKNPAALADPKWAAIGPAWYWTVARPTIPALADAGDLLAVTKLINGGTNGLQDRTDRYNQALALGDRLLKLVNPPTAGGPLMALTDDEQQEVLTKVREMWDQLRGPDGAGWPQLGQNDQGQNHTPVDALAGIQTLLATDIGNIGLGAALQTAITQVVQAELAKAQQPAT